MVYLDTLANLILKTSLWAHFTGKESMLYKNSTDTVKVTKLICGSHLLTSCFFESKINASVHLTIEKSSEVQLMLD